MRILASIALLAAAAAAQTTLNTNLTANNGGNIGGGLYFDLQVNSTITITSLNLWCGAASTATTTAYWELWLGPTTYVGNVTNPSLWTKVADTATVSVTGGAYQLFSNVNVIPVPAIAAVTLAPGNYGFAVKAVGCSNGYTNGLTCTSTSIPGSCSNTLFSTPEVTLRGGAAQNAFLSGGIFTPRMFAGAITYTNGGTPITFASRQPYGNGCYARYRSFYEFYPSSVGVNDLANTSIRLVYDGVNNRYQAVAGTTAPAIVTSPSLAHAANNDIVVPLANSQPIIFPNIGGPGIVTTSVNMNSNGYISLNGTVPSVDNPTIAAWLTGTSARIGYHHNMDPSVGGTTHYDYDAANAAHLFTWNAVPDQAIAATSNTIQLAFFASGDVEFRFGALSVSGGGAWPTLVGYTPGNGAADPGSVDLPSALPLATAGIDAPALALASNANPVLGSTINLTVSNPTSTNLGLTFICLADLGPLSSIGGLDLALIGAPGCVANVDINTGTGFLISNLGLPGFPTMVTPFSVPASPLSLIGLNLYSQGVWLDATQNGAGLLTSNALRLTIGSF